MKLRSTLLIIALVISGVSIAIIVGVFVFPYLNTSQDGPNIIYIAPYTNNTHTCILTLRGVLPNYQIKILIIQYGTLVDL